MVKTLSPRSQLNPSLTRRAIRRLTLNPTRGELSPSQPRPEYGRQAVARQARRTPRGLPCTPGGGGRTLCITRKVLLAPARSVSQRNNYCTARMAAACVVGAAWAFLVALGWFYNYWGASVSGREPAKRLLLRPKERARWARSLLLRVGRPSATNKGDWMSWSIASAPPFPRNQPLPHSFNAALRRGINLKKRQALFTMRRPMRGVSRVGETWTAV